ILFPSATAAPSSKKVQGLCRLLLLRMITIVSLLRKASRIVSRHLAPGKISDASNHSRSRADLRAAANLVAQSLSLAEYERKTLCARFFPNLDIWAPVAPVSSELIEVAINLIKSDHVPFLEKHRRIWLRLKLSWRQAV